MLDRVCDGDPVRGGHAFDKLRLLEKQPGGKEQLRAMFLKSDADIRQLLPEVLDPPEGGHLPPHRTLPVGAPHLLQKVTSVTVSHTEQGLDEGNHQPHKAGLG